MSRKQTDKSAALRWVTPVFAAFFVIAAVLLGWLYLDDHSWGANGDDSAGYIYLAGRMYSGLPLVYEDELAKAGYDHFGDERLARWLTPTHHQFINTQGVLASKYPVGASILMAATGTLLRSDEAFYYVVPVLAVVNVILLYVLAVLLLPGYRYRHLVGFLAGTGLGLSSLYYNYAIAQPMREIPSMAFLLLAAVCMAGYWRVTAAKEKSKQTWWMWGLLAVAGFAMGAAFTIRETSLMVLPALAVFGIMMLWKPGKPVMTQIRTVWPQTLVVAVFMVFAAMPIVLNSAAISAEKEVFKQRDTSETVLLSNIGHLETISVENVFNSEGKFRPKTGSLPHYWNVMQNSVPIPYFMLLAILGVGLWWKRSRETTVFLVLWVLGTLTIFSMWINPYARYILPLFPPLILLGAYGGVAAVEELLPRIVPTKWLYRVLVAAMALTVVVAYIPTVTDAYINLTQEDVYRFKAISRGDLQTLKQIGSTLDEQYEKPVVLFAGSWQYGVSETFEAHTGVKTVRFPFEQDKFIFDEEEVNTFFDDVLLPEYDLIVWADPSGTSAFYDWFAEYERTFLGQHQFTFQSGVRLYEFHQRLEATE